MSDGYWRRVSAVVVAHNSGAVIGACLASILPAAEIIVVDNASSDDTPDAVAKAAPRAVVVGSGGNIGFGSAANEGVRRAGGEFALLVNPDAELLPGAVERLVAAADRYPRAAILAPALVGGDGAVARSHDLSLVDRAGMPRKRTDPPPEGDVCVGFVSGAVLLLRKSAIEETGPFDPAIFMFYEDDDLCLRLRRAGWSTVLVPEARARHIGGASNRWSWGSHWRKFWHMGWSRLYFERKHRGVASMRREAARALVRYSGKTLSDLVRLNAKKATRDFAQLCGTAGFLLGLESRAS